MQLTGASFVRLRALSACHCLFENGSDATARAVRRRSGVGKCRRTQVSIVLYKAEKYYPEDASQVTPYVIV